MLSVSSSTGRNHGGSPLARSSREELHGDVPRYSIDELSARSGVPSRTIRFYQARGLLPAPERLGRSVFYGPEHEERLELVAHLQDRGLHLRAIRELLRRGEVDSLSVQDWLGISERLRAPWSDDRPEVVSGEELAKRIGDRPAGTLALLEKARLVLRERAADGSFRIPSPGLLDVSLRLLDAGIDLGTVREAGEIVRRHAGKAARELVDRLARRAGRGFGRAATADDVSAAIEALRPVAADAVRLIFASELERALRAHVESAGRSSSPQRRR